MAHRTLHTDLETSLLNNDAFSYAHLVKFEKPITTETGYPVKTATDYAYISDGSFDMTWNDGSEDINGGANGAQVYIANRLIKVGSVTETIQARASNINLEISAVALNTTMITTCTIASTTITAATSIVDAGFAEGDTILLTTAGANNTATVRIDSFSNDNKTIAYTLINRASALTTGSASYTLTFASDEVNAILADNTSTTYAGYINREVFVYKAHINPDTGAIIGEPYLLFKGIIASGKLSEDVTKTSKISWGLTSHWGDFVRVNGRLTSDGEHRALNGEGTSDSLALIRPEYGGDLGFMHSEQAINLIANYNVMITKTKLIMKRKWYGSKSYKQVEYQEEESREVDLRFNLDAKRLPVIYGVQRTESFPVFVDTLDDDSKKVYVAYAICEGEIGGLYDVYLDDQSSICVDKNDLATRGAGTTTAEVVCNGRMERGDTLQGRAISTGTRVMYPGVGANFGGPGGRWRSDLGIGPDGIPGFAVRNNTLNSSVGSGSSAGAAGGGGITHGKGTKFNTPIPLKLTMHTGKPFQKSDDTLSAISAAGNFKIQNDYFEGTGDYWGPNHRLLDTAYATAEYTIGEGDTTIPELEFIVRGRVLDCYDYDYSYTQDIQYASADAAITAFNIGDIVSIKNTVGNGTLDTATIADITSYKNVDNVTVNRVRLTGPALSLIGTSFYMRSADGLNDYHFVTYDHVYLSSTVPNTLTTTTTFSDNSGGSSINATFTNPSAALQEAIARAEFLSIINNSDLADLRAAMRLNMANTFEFTNVSGVLSDIGQVAGSSDIASTVQVIIKDCIQLNSEASSDDSKYVGLDIDLTRKFDDNSIHTQKRRITEYDGGTKVAKVDRPFDDVAIPQAADTFKIYSLGDKRVSINPAIQLVDYLTNPRYGRGLDVNEDLNVEAFKTAARDCDTRSDVTMLLANTTIAKDAIYKLVDSNGKLRFQGTVKDTPVTVTISGTAYDEVTFTNVIGKVASKWTDYAVYEDGEYLWHNGKIYEKTGAGSITSAPSGSSSSVEPLTKVSGTGPSTVAIDVVQETFEGNPIVKKYNSTTGNFGSGYSLYDCDDVKYWRYVGWDAPIQSSVTRHQTNAIIPTTSSVFENINAMLAHFNGVLRYVNGKYDIVVKTATDTFGAAQSIGDDDIIGSIGVEDAGQKGTYNSVSVGIPDPQQRYKARSVNFFDSTYLKQDRNVPKKGNMKTPFITNYFNARINAKQYLEESRTGLKVVFKLQPKALLLTAGSLIKITNTRLGWANKEFRITNLTFMENCLVNVTAEEHSPTAYLISTINSSSKKSPGESAGAATGIAPPTNLALPTNNLTGGTRITWNNSAKFNPVTHTTEIWRHTANNVADAIMVGTSKSGIASGPAEHTDPVTAAGAYYYWIRYTVALTRTTAQQFNSVYVGVLTATVTAVADGDPALTARLTANQYVIPYDSTDNETTTIILTATATNFAAGNRTYKFYVDDGTTTTLKQTTTNTLDTHTFELADGDEPANGSQKTIKLEIIQGSTTAKDSTSIYGVKDGESAFTVVFTNEAHTIPADEEGLALTYANSGTDIRVFKGSTALTYGTGANTFSVAVLSDTDITVNTSPTTEQFAVANDTRRYGIAGGMANADTSASITYSITARSDDAIDTVLTKAQSFTKGNAGAGAKTVNLTASQYVIPYTLADSETTTITLTAMVKNISGSKIYKFYVDDGTTTTLIPGTGTTGGTQTTTGNTVTCDIPQTLEPANGEQITVRVDIVQASAVISTDSTSIYGIKDGSDAFTVILTNEAHAIPATSAGVPKTYASSGTDIRVFLGSTPLTYGTNANQFTVSAVSGNDIDPNASPSTEQFNIANDTRRYGIASGMLNNAFADFITYTIVAKNGEGTASTFTKIQSFTKGNDGVNADALTITSNTITNGIRTLVFSDGENLTINGGLNTSTVALYKKSTSNSTAPADPTGTFTYRFANGEVTGGTLSGWATAVPDLSNEEYAWVILATASNRNDTDSIPVGEFSPAVVHSGGGETGTTGNSNALVSLYRVSTNGSSSPTSFTGTITYTFNGGGVTTDGNFNSWTTSVPSVPKGSYLWIRQGTVSSNGLTATIAIGSWSGAAIASSGGIDGIDNGVVPVYASSASGSNKSFVITDSAFTNREYVNFYEWTGSKPQITATVIADLSLFVKIVGEDGDSEGVIPVYSTNASGTGTNVKSFSITDSNFTDRRYVNFYEWSDDKPQIGDSRITALNSFVKFVGDSFKTVEIFKLNDTTVGFSSGNATGQTYASPVNGLEAGWSTTQPALVSNGDKVYMSRRTFSEDNLAASGNEIAWSAPVVVAEKNDSTVPGPNGLRSTQGYLYYEKTTAGNPPTPEVDVFNISNGIITNNTSSNSSRVHDGGTTNVWKNSPNTQDATSLNTYYTVRYYGTEASASSTDITVTYTNIVKHTSFTGVVTFSGGTLTDRSGSGDITPVEAADISASINTVTQTTTIDGGRLTTGSINADRLTIGNTTITSGTTSALKLYSDALKIFSGGNLRVKIGNLNNITDE